MTEQEPEHGGPSAPNFHAAAERAASLGAAVVMPVNRNPPDG